MIRDTSPLPRRASLALAMTISLLATLLALGCQPASGTAGDASSEEDRLVASTQYGSVRGYEEDGILVFKGVRYGADTATTRFAAPAPPEPWTEVRDALSYGNSAPQGQRSSIGLFESWAPDPVPTNSEDCLFLNVWTPALGDEALRPVMVWFHGGGFTSGSGSSNAYDGVRLAKRGDVVVVTVNHRLNLFGYTYLDEFGEQFAGSGNAGMLDLVASLEWVRDNVAEFGGDPGNVLIFGESGGGWKVSTLMAMDAARGLFHRAVAQSGPGLEAEDPEPAGEATRALLAELGLEEATIDQIRTLPAAQLQAAAAAIAEAGGSVPGRRPVVDGIHLVRHPFSPDAPEQSKDVPLLIGSARTEMSLLAGARRPELFELTFKTLPEALERAMPGVDAQAVIEGYRTLHPELDAPTLYFEVTSDNSTFVRGSFELADRKAAQGGALVYQYYLSWSTPVDDGKWGAPHALDIGMVFDNVAKSESMSGVGEEQQNIADMMSEAWLAFARSGDPNHPGLPTWSPYDAERRATMVFDVEPVLVDDPRRRELNLIDSALRD